MFIILKRHIIVTIKHVVIPSDDIHTDKQIASTENVLNGTHARALNEATGGTKNKRRDRINGTHPEMRQGLVLLFQYVGRAASVADARVASYNSAIEAISLLYLTQYVVLITSGHRAIIKELFYFSLF